MTVYIDGLLFLNFYLDFLLLLTCVVILKRNVKMFRIILGAFIGSLTIFVLLLKITSLELFFIKIYLSLIMCIVCFGYKNLKSFFINVGTFYMVSILLGGFLYFLNITFSYKHKGMLFFNDGFSINALFLIIISPIVLYFYVHLYGISSFIMDQKLSSLPYYMEFLDNNGNYRFIYFVLWCERNLV